MSISSTFTCLTCSVRFQDYEIQREHYKSDFHRYNLKRKVSELPPVTVEDFQNRVVQARSQEQEEFVDKGLYCKACNKFFKSQNSHDNHLNSKKHRESLIAYLDNNKNDEEEIEDVIVSVKAMDILEERRLQRVEEDDDMDAESVESDEWDDDTENPIANNNCIFCEHHSKNLVNNMKHMSIAHSFFIPDAEFCSDLEGLLSYLAEKVVKDFMCTWCNESGRVFYSVNAVRRHMTEKGHCKMLHEGSALAEYVDFYDYSSSYPDHDESKDIDEVIENPDLLEGDEYQLVLPSGMVIGHRSLMRYYKQKINPNRAVVLKKSDRKLHKVLAEYRSLGWTSTQQQAAAKTARDISVMKRTQAKLYAKVGIKANKLQHHYRAQVLF